MSNAVDQTTAEPETVLSDEEWLEAKRLALAMAHGDMLDRPDAHLAYVRERIAAALNQDVA